VTGPGSMLTFLPAGPSAAVQSGRRCSWEDEPMEEEVIPVLRVSAGAAAVAW